MREKDSKAQMSYFSRTFISLEKPKQTYHIPWADIQMRRVN